MYRNKTITLCLPCRNEGKHLKQVLKKVPSFVDEIIVISNKSDDDTVNVARKLGVRVFEDNRTIGNIGYGYAHMTGIFAAIGDIIVGADGDGTYPVEQLEEIIDHFLDNQIQFLSCNRHPLKDETKIPPMIRFGVWSLGVEVRVLYGRKIHDILSGMWLIDSNVKYKLNLCMGDWNLSPEIKINAATHPDIKFSEYHIIQHDRMGETKQNYWATGLTHMWWIFKNRFRAVKRTTRDIYRTTSANESLQSTMQVIAENDSMMFTKTTIK
jgi:glycosyltransferase involved in cell wall biosynthesis